MKPMNRHLKIQISSPAPLDMDGVLMPVDYKVVQEWQSAIISEVSEDCTSFTNADIGSMVVFAGNMLMSVDALGNQYHFVQENYIVCKSSGAA